MVKISFIFFALAIGFFIGIVFYAIINSVCKKKIDQDNTGRQSWTFGDESNE